MPEVTVHDLSQGRPASGAPTVLLVHGITGNGLCWREVAAELGRRRGDGALRVLAPDLRGRAESREVGPPYGMGAHAADMAQIARAQDGPVLLVGHSMGAFVAAVAMATDPTPYVAALLVDGALALPMPDGIDVDTALQAVIGPAMTRLSMRFESPQAYLDFWRQHPAVGPLLAGPAAETTQGYILHDLMPAPDDDGYVSTCVLEAIREDGGAVLVDPSVAPATKNALERGARMELIWAARGMLNEPQGLYDEGRLAAHALPESLRITRADANHYSVILDPAGVATICDAIDRLLPASPRHD